MMAFTKIFSAHWDGAFTAAGSPDLFDAFIADESGATAIEYGLIVSLIFLAVVGAIRGVSTETDVMYDELENAMASTNP